MFLRSGTVTATLGADSMSTAPTYVDSLNGLVHSIEITAAKAMPTSMVTVLRGTSTTLVLLRIKDPSTLGGTYYPRAAAHSSSGASLGSTHVAAIPLKSTQRIGLLVHGASSSGKSSSGGSVTAIINVI